MRLSIVLRIVVAVVIAILIYMTLAGWAEDSRRVRFFSISFSAFMLLLAVGVAFPSRGMWPLRAVAGIVAITYSWYAYTEWRLVAHGEVQVFDIGRPSAAMALLGLFVIGFPSAVFALSGTNLLKLGRRDRDGGRGDGSGTVL
mgnify:CR=1 FL=1|jgi:hypothetical protein